MANGLRNKYQIPFSSAHVANTSIGSGATYYPAGVYYRCDTGYCTEFGGDADVVILRDTSSTPLQNFYPFVGFGWGGGTNRCATESGTVINQLPVPNSWIIPDNGENMSTSILMPDGHSIKQTQPIAHCSGSPWTTKYNFDTIDIYGTSTAGPHGGSNLSGAAFAIKRGEFTSGAIHHAMGINMYAAQYYKSDCSYSWPATTVDGYCAGNYGGSNPYLRPGALLALKPDFNVNGLRTEPGRIIARAFQDFGGYIGDDTSWNFWAIWTAQDDTGSVESEFNALYPGITFRQTTGSTPFMLDMRDVFTALHIVNNNGPSNVGGGGTRRVATYPAIGN